jgi:hypothetical protein
MHEVNPNEAHCFPMKLLTTISRLGTYFGILSRFVLTLVYFCQDILSQERIATIINSKRHAQKGVVSTEYIVQMICEEREWKVGVHFPYTLRFCNLHTSLELTFTYCSYESIVAKLITLDTTLHKVINYFCLHFIKH